MGLLFDMAGGCLAGADLAAAWLRWRDQRPDIETATLVEVAFLPAVWHRLKECGITDTDAALLDGLQRKALVNASMVLSDLAAAQDRLRGLGVESAVGGGAAAILWGALSPSQRPLSHGEIWVSRRHWRTARRALAGPSQVGPSTRTVRQSLTGTCVIPHKRLTLRSRIPSVPPMDARPLLAHTQSVTRQKTRFGVLGPTEVVFVSEAQNAAAQVGRRIRSLAGVQSSRSPENALRQLDRALLRRSDGYSQARLEQLLAAAGWQWREAGRHALCRCAVDGQLGSCHV